MFSEGGYSGTSLRQIASAVGCDVALIPYYFISKPLLFEAAVGSALTPVREPLTNRRDGSPLLHDSERLALRALLLTAGAGDSAPQQVVDYTRRALQGLIDSLVSGDERDEHTKFRVASFVGMLIGAEVLTQALNFAPLAARDDVLDRQLVALERILGASG